DNSDSRRVMPVTVIHPSGDPLSNVVAIAAGVLHTCALISNGSVQCWGDNFDGALGDGTTTDRLTPVTVLSAPFIPLSNVLAVAGSTSFGTCVLIADGTARCWGENAAGRLGNNSTVPSFSSSAVQVSGLTQAVAIATGGGQACSIVGNGGVFCWGADNAGEIG